MQRAIRTTDVVGIQRKIPRERVDGVLLLDKPQGLSSNTALQVAKRLLNAAKAGHTGTLDPMATGLLPLTFGEATKFSQMLLDADKAYEATLKLGVETDSGDAEGAVVATSPVDVDASALEQALTAFRGEIDQVPPMYSALKRDGKPLYEYARAGIELERKARRVTIFRLECLAFDGDLVRISVHCSKGTYIRSLAMDLGKVLGCGAHLAALRRTGIGDFRVDDAVALEDFESTELAERKRRLAPVDALVCGFESVGLSPEHSAAILQGRPVSVPDASEGLLRLYADDRFLGIGVRDEAGVLRAKRLVATQ